MVSVIAYSRSSHVAVCIAAVRAAEARRDAHPEILRRHRICLTSRVSGSHLSSFDGHLRVAPGDEKCRGDGGDDAIQGEDAEPGPR